MVIRVVLGKDFIQSIPVLQVFSIVWGIMFFNELFTKFLNASNRQILATKAMAICLTVNVILDVVLIYFFGYFGAVFATLLAETSLSIAAYLFISRTMAAISWKKVLPKPLLAAVPMAVVAAFFQPVSPFIASLAGLGIFVIGLFVLKTFEPDEIEIFKEVFRKTIGFLNWKTYQKRTSK
jgi:O-antigen/teichoic acid export membrane protein